MKDSRPGVELAALIVVLACGGSALADEGMWLLNRPPNKLLKERYGFEATPAWLGHLQRAAVRIGAGGSGSIVSSEGLVMTNHHVGHDTLEKLSTAERNLLQTGFYAATHAAELKCPDLEVNVLESIEDVTDKVNSAASADMKPADANAARRKRMSELENELEKKTGLQGEVVTLYHGARYHLYGYHRHADVRMVMAPEEQIAFFGGDNDNFEYPRFNLDMCFFRIYENDKPLQTKDHLKWSAAGAKDGDLTFVLGHPGRTQRLFTVEHLEFLRDVETPSILRKYWRREVQLQTFAARSDENARVAHGDMRGIENSRKAFTGILAGLQDPAVMKAKTEAEAKLRAAVAANPEYKKNWNDAWDRLAAAHRTYREFFERYHAIEGRRAALRSDLLSIARHLVRLAEEKRKPSGERLREYADSNLPSIELDLFSPAPVYDALERSRLESGLAFLIEAFGPEDPFVKSLLDGASPRERAIALVGLQVEKGGAGTTPAQASVKGTQLKDVAFRRKLYEGGSVAIASSTDPMIQFVRKLDVEARRLRKRYEDEVESVERECYAKIAAAKFAIEGDDVYPDATFTLRMSFGPIRGYTDDDYSSVPPFTTFAGMYDRFKLRRGAPPFDLPPRWLEAKDKLKLDTPFNFVCTADIIGGNSGSPVVNKGGEVVGLIFDGNIQSLVWDIVFTEVQGRAVAVDSRAIIESLRNVYGAGALADELTRG